jgi:hypothetical protein
LKVNITANIQLFINSCGFFSALLWYQSHTAKPYHTGKPAAGGFAVSALHNLITKGKNILNQKHKKG